MRTSALVVLLMAGLSPTPVRAQVPRDTPSPSMQNARRERELRSLAASGGATGETYLELAKLDILLNRPDDAVAALQSPADLQPTAPEVQYRLGTIAWDYANRDVASPAGQLFIRAGVALEDRALRLKPDYSDAMTYKNVLLRMQARLTLDADERTRLLAEADALRNRVIELRGLQPLPTDTAPASFTGFSEPFDQTVATLTPVRVGGAIRQPTKTRDVKPTYPADAQKDRLQGVVIIEALIGPAGSVANARILRSILALDEAALSAVSQWQFAPTLVNGVPVAVLMTVTVNFTLQ